METSLPKITEFSATELWWFVYYTSCNFSQSFAEVNTSWAFPEAKLRHFNRLH